MRMLIRDLADGFRNPEFWALSAWLDIVVKSRRSRLGVFWLMMPSIVYVWGVGTLFSALMHTPLQLFAAHVAVGWTVFRVVNSVTTEATSVLFDSRTFIMDGHMRLSDFALRTVAKACFYFLMSLPAVVMALAIFPHLSWTGTLIGLAAFPVVLLNALWIAVLFSLIGARFPDLSQFIGNIFMFLFLLTPIVWYPESMPATSLRGTLARMNPFYHLIEIVRAPFLGESIGTMYSWYYVIIMTVVGWTAAIVVYRRYARFVPIWL